MDLGLSGKTVVVAGSSRGIGKAVARRFLAEGARVLLSGRDKATLEGTQSEFLAEFPSDRVGAYCGDLLTSHGVMEYLDATVARWGTVDVAVANIGSGKGVSFEASDEREWMRGFELNLFPGMIL